MCLDEVDHLALETLCALAHQLGKVRKACLGGLESLELEGAIVPLRSPSLAYGVLSGRPGAPPLPTGFRELFRPVAMAPPDKADVVEPAQPADLEHASPESGRLCAEVCHTRTEGGRSLANIGQMLSKLGRFQRSMGQTRPNFVKHCRQATNA